MGGQDWAEGKGEGECGASMGTWGRELRYGQAWIRDSADRSALAGF